MPLLNFVQRWAEGPIDRSSDTDSIFRLYRPIQSVDFKFRFLYRPIVSETFKFRSFNRPIVSVGFEFRSLYRPIVSVRYELRLLNRSIVFFDLKFRLLYRSFVSVTRKIRLFNRSILSQFSYLNIVSSDRFSIVKRSDCIVRSIHLRSPHTSTSVVHKLRSPKFSLFS